MKGNSSIHPEWIVAILAILIIILLISLYTRGDASPLKENYAPFTPTMSAPSTSTEILSRVNGIMPARLPSDIRGHLLCAGDNQVIFDC